MQPDTSRPNESSTEADSLSDRIERALERARAAPESAAAGWAAFQLVFESAAYERFKDAIAVTAAHIEAIARSESLLLDYGFAAWVALEADLGEACYKRALSLNQANETTYRRLASLYLTSQRWADAYFVAHAARDVLRNEQALQDIVSLVDLLVAGTNKVSFEVDGQRYVFRLSCKNGQAMEADQYHVAGLLVELEELRYLKSWLPPVDRIVECGCLVGNHTVFFLKNLSPKVIDIYDASRWSLDEMAANVGLNATDEMQTELNCHHRAIARRSGDTIELLGDEVETVSLADAIGADANFVKVDIDGMELESLEGLLEGLARSRAWLMIEVRSKDVPLFKERLASIGYRLDREMQRNVDSNLFFAPAEQG